MRQQVRLNLSPFEDVAFGPMIDVENKRDDGVKSPRVVKPPELDCALEAGSFIAHSRRACYRRRID